MALPARFRQLLIRKGVRLSHVRASQVRRQRQKKKCATTLDKSPTGSKTLSENAADPPSTSEVAPIEQHSRLLDLPAELRNTIFELALLDETVDIKHRSRLPGLLSACRQLRKETLSMWFTRSSFALEIHNCDGIIYTKWDRLLQEIEAELEIARDTIMVETIHTGRASWQNLKAWLHYRFERKLKFRPEDSYPVSGPGPQGFYDAANELLNEFMDKEWVDFDLCVENMRSMLLWYDQTWLR